LVRRQSIDGVCNGDAGDASGLNRQGMRSSESQVP
jgi:hypothetical protein